MTVVILAILNQAFPPIGAIEVYGNRKIPRGRIVRALGLKPGVGPPMDEEKVVAMKNRIKRLGAVRAHISYYCCTSAGKSTVTVGVEEAGATRLDLRPAPLGDARLRPELLEAYDAMMNALHAAVLAGDARAEDSSTGHALMGTPAVRAIQERFPTQAVEHLDELRAVLRESSEPAHRAAAAWIIAYAPDKASVVRDLLLAARDPSEMVRNNALRALGTMALAGHRLTPEPFVDFLNSAVWTDRNKGLMVLLALTKDRPPEVLRLIRTRALPSLIEMVRGEQYDRAAYTMLARIAGFADPPEGAIVSRREREKVLKSLRYR